jgi:ferrochelatase
MKKTAVLLVNLGTPEAPTEEAVRAYLKEFLWDPRVVQIPRFIWWFILNWVVLRIRPAQSAEAYQKVWTEEGSPLMVFSKRIKHKLQALANIKEKGRYEFFLGMRYGSPSIASVIEEMKSKAPDDIILLPLYPQFATSSTGTALHAFQQALKEWKNAPRSKTIMDYHDNAAYINALAESVKKHWANNGQAECLLMSFHGVPVRTIKQGDPYLSHCTKTAELLANKLGLDTSQWRLVFQSRFGKAKWIQPYCLDVLQALPNEGIRRIDVICPGFSADCLETLEEIALQNRDVFLAAGGESYRYIAALNDNDSHIDALFSLLVENDNTDSEVIKEVF